MACARCSLSKIMTNCDRSAAETRTLSLSQQHCELSDLVQDIDAWENNSGTGSLVGQVYHDVFQVGAALADFFKPLLHDTKKQHANNVCIVDLSGLQRYV